MSKPLPGFVAEFNSLVKESENMLSIARDSELQRAACYVLEDALQRTRTEKHEAIAGGDEDYANLLLGCESVARALLAEINMWLLLKEEKPNEAWNHLVAAQMASVDAARAHEGFHHLEHHHQRLEAIENLVFPPQVFVSSGMLVGFQECSICGHDYDECEHLVGKPYMGQFCYIIARDIALDHVAIVTHPADKRCRIEQFSVEGGTRNRMTWRIEPESHDA